MTVHLRVVSDSEIQYNNVNRFRGIKGTFYQLKYF